MFLGLLCLTGSLSAGTYYTYTGNPYPPSTGCGGAYVCNGTTPSLTITFYTTLSGSQLDNLAIGTTGQISSTVTSWTVTDHDDVTITPSSNSAAFTVNLTTDANGNPTAWTVYATATADNGAGGSEYGCTTDQIYGCFGSVLLGDQSSLNNPPNPTESLYADGNLVFEYPYNGTPGTWVLSQNPPITINTATVAFPAPNTFYSQTLSVTGGLGPPYTWSASANAPTPAWLTLDSTGVLHGTPPAAGAYTFAAQATDSMGNPSPLQTITVQVNLSNTVITTNLPVGMAIVNISGATSTPTVGGNGAADYYNPNGANQTTWAAPFNTVGQFLEYTIPPGTYTIRVIDPADAAVAFPALTQSQLNSMWTAWSYSGSSYVTPYLAFDSSAASNSSETQLFSGAEGIFPDVPTATPAAAYNNAITGNGGAITPYYNEIYPTYRNATPQKTITFPLVGTGPETLLFADPDYDLSDNSDGVSVLIAPYTSTPSVTTTSLPGGQVGVPYSLNVTATGGSGIYSWSAVNLPLGLTLSPTGNPAVLSGTPTHVGGFQFVQITVTDPVSGLSSTIPFSLNVAAPSPALTISTTSIPQGEVGVTYSHLIVATGGYGAYTFSISSGSAGPLSLNSTFGVLSSSGPLSGGNDSQFTVTVTDAAGDSFTSPTYTLLVDGAVSITTSSVPNAAVNESYGAQLIASGGTLSYTWISTDKPSWLALASATGVLSGVPPPGTSTSTPFNFHVTVTDSANGTQTVPLTLQVSLPVGYVVENLTNVTTGDLAFVPADGTPPSNLSGGGTVGLDVAQDAGTNTVLLLNNSLYRIPTFGRDVGSIVANPNEESSWAGLAVDGFGNLIVGDVLKHGVWRVSTDGLSVAFVRGYPVPNRSLVEDIKILVDVHGNYIVAEDNNSTVGLFSITPAGVVNAIPLTGGTLPVSVGGLAFDQNGNYMLLDTQQEALYQISPGGVTTLFVPAGDLGSGASGIARNPLTNQYVVGLPNGVEEIPAGGGAGETTLATSAQLLATPSSIYTFTEDFPSTVDATNPMAYFRLETRSGFSEVNGSYSYNLTGGATISNPGAPIGIPANNSALLDGSTGYVATSFAGNVNTAGSMMAWVNLSALPSTTGEQFNYVAGESQTGNDFDLQFNSNNVLGFYTTNNGANLSYTPNPATLVGQWHMIAATFDATAGTRALYWDGSLVASDNITSLTNKTLQFQIGSSPILGGRNFPGGIDEVGVWNYALTAPQVYRMFASRPLAEQNINNFPEPASVPQNSGATTLTIPVKDLVAGSSVWFTSPSAQSPFVETNILTPTPPVSANQLVVTIPAALLTTEGIAEVSVVSPAGVPSNQLPFTIQGRPLSIGPLTSTLSNGQVNEPYSEALTATGGSGNYSWSITSQSTGLNLSLSPATGTPVSLIGTPTQAYADESATVTVLLTDTTTGLTVEGIYGITIGAPAYAPLQIFPPAGIIQTGVAGETYSLRLTAIGGSGNYSWSITSQSPGLNLAISPLTGANPSLTGTPTEVYPESGGSLRVLLTDTTANLTATVPWSITILPALAPTGAQPASTTAYVLNEDGSLVSLTGGVASSFAPSPGNAFYADIARDAAGNFIVAAESQLNGYTANGRPLPGFPLVAGEGSSYVSVAIDSSGNYIVADDAKHQILRITPPNPPSIPQVVVAATYPVSFPTYEEDAYVRVDSNGNYILAEDNNLDQNNPLPLSLFFITPGLNVTPIPIPITGSVPVATGGLTFDSHGNYVNVDWNDGIINTIAAYGTANAGTSTVLLSYPNGADSDPLGIYRDPLSGDFFLVDDEYDALYTFAPDGSHFSLIASGPLFAAGPSAVVVVDAVAPPTPPVEPVAPTVPSLSITLSPGSISTTTGGFVSASFAASGGTGSYTFSLSGQPAGVTISSGSLGGTPTQAGSFNTTVGVTDSNQDSASASITINVLGLTTTALPGGTVGQLYTASIGAAGGASSYSFSATGLPAGLSLTGYGYLSGTVKAAGIYPIGVTVFSGGLSSGGTLSLTIAPPQALSITQVNGFTTGPNGTVNVPYSQALSATGGTPPYTWSLISGTLPRGLSLNPSGIVSGTPGTPGSFSYGVQVTDTVGAASTATASITIQAAPLLITTSSLPAGMNGVDYPLQQLTVSGGVSPYIWTLGNGGALPAGLTLSSDGVLSGMPGATATSSARGAQAATGGMGAFTVEITVTDHANTQDSTTFPLTIRPSSDDLILTSGSLSFSLSSPATSPPASQVVGVQATVPSQPIAYTLSVNPPAPWLALANGTTTPDSIQVSITSAALTLSPGAYPATITATCTSSSCSGHTQTVSVSLTVTALPPQLQTSTGLVSFATTSTALGSLSQPINIQNAGGGTLGFASISCEAAWCTVRPSPQSLAGGVGAAIPVTVNPGLLTPGFYRTQVDIASSGGTGAVPVTLFISAYATMTLAPAGELFNQPAGSTPGNPNGSFLVSVNNSTPVSFSAAIVPIQGLPVPNWLMLGTPSGSASSTQPGTVSFSIDPVTAGALAPGGYYGEIQIASPDLSNSPENFEVVLNVTAADAPQAPDPEPGGLLFITAVGGVLPAQTVTVYSGSPSALTFQASAATTDGAGWLSVTPDTGSASAAASGVTTVGVNTSRLTAGVYQGGVSYSLSATAVRTVNVTLIVIGTGGAGTTSALSPDALPHASSCTPSVLVPAQTGLVNSFAQPAGWPVPLQILLSNDCGSVVNNGQIVATFSNGDPPLALSVVNPAAGLYSGTWSPANPSSQVAIDVSANAPGYPAAASRIAGAVLPNAVPLLSPNGTLHSFDPLIGAALAPGTIVAIYGQNLAAAATPTTTIPLPTALNGTSVIIGGTEAPLYYVSPGQINAQIPFELEPENQYQVIVSANGALTTPQPIQLSTATPGLAALSDGTLIAQHSNGSLVSQTAPAMGGEYLVVYLAGLGQTTVPVASGAASPSSPLAMPSATPVLTINGTQYPTLFAGLTPGLVGLYQMNFQVPAGLPAGDITVVVSQSGQPSNQTVLPYQP
jgi:uncharacterized protein (TIGR03437 family)